MREVRTVADSRTADLVAAAQVGEGVLIARAAAALASAASAWLGGAYGRRVCVLAGSGHNGADALRAGAILARRGAAVTVVRSSTRDGDHHVQAAWDDALAAGVRETTVLGEPDLVIDGMVGIGSTAEPLAGRSAELVAELGELPVLAVDVPSGVDADTGRVRGAAVAAAVTVTFGSLKPGLLVGAGRDHSGQVVVAGIGLELESSEIWVVDAADTAHFLPTPTVADDKRTRGVVGVIAGSDPYPGAGMLCVGGAVRAGAGYVRAPGAPREVLAAFPSAVAADGRCDAWVVGPGVDEARWKDAAHVLDFDGPLIVDATALDLMGVDAITARTAATVITPHAGEFQRLIGEDPATDPVGATQSAAQRLGAMVVLKGATTIVAAPDGTVRLVLTPTGWLATAGTGDVLSGVTGALVAAAVQRGAAGGELADAVAAAVFLHGVAGRLAADRGVGDAAIAADDLLAALGTAAASIRSAM